jgi:hypothetical protein
MAILPVIAISRGEAEKIEELMPADGVGAATEKWVIGTPRWQLSD